MALLPRSGAFDGLGSIADALVNNMKYKTESNYRNAENLRQEEDLKLRTRAADQLFNQNAEMYPLDIAGKTATNAKALTDATTAKAELDAKNSLADTLGMAGRPVALATLDKFKTDTAQAQGYNPVPDGVARADNADYGTYEPSLTGVQQIGAVSRMGDVMAKNTAFNDNSEAGRKASVDDLNNAVLSHLGLPQNTNDPAITGKGTVPWANNKILEYNKQVSIDKIPLTPEQKIEYQLAINTIYGDKTSTTIDDAGHPRSLTTKNAAPAGFIDPITGEAPVAPPPGAPQAQPVDPNDANAAVNAINVDAQGNVVDNSNLKPEYPPGPVSQAQYSAVAMEAPMQQFNQFVGYDPKTNTLNTKSSLLNSITVPDQLQGMFGDALGPLGSRVTPENVQRYGGAAGMIVSEVLRKESGAVINPSETQDMMKFLVPVPGEPENVTMDKVARMQGVAAAFRAVGGPSNRTPGQAMNIIYAAIAKVDALRNNMRNTAPGVAPAPAQAPAQGAAPSIDDVMKMYGG